MAIAPQATVRLKASAGLLPAGDGGGTQTANVDIDLGFASGTGVAQIDTPFKDIRTLGAGANEDLDLQALLDANGVALGYTGVRFISIEADSGNGADVRLAPAAVNGWISWIAVGSLMDVEAGGFVAAGSPRSATPYLVGAANKDLNVLNLDGANAITYTITIYGF